MVNAWHNYLSVVIKHEAPDTTSLTPTFPTTTRVMLETPAFSTVATCFSATVATCLSATVSRCFSATVATCLSAKVATC